jgi:hypothetical protein
MHRTPDDNEAAFRHQGAKTFVRCWLLCVNPNHQQSTRVEKRRQPVDRRLKRVKRASPPIQKRNVVLTCWTAAISRRRRQQISAPLQLHHQFHAFRPGYQDTLPRRAARKRDHRINNSVARSKLRRHNITCFRSFSPVRSGPGEIIVCEVAKASVLAIAPFAGLQTAFHASLADSHGPISSGLDLISRALQPQIHMGRIRSAVSIAFGTNHTGFGTISVVGGTIRFLENDKAVALEFLCAPVHLVGKYSPTVARTSEEWPGVLMVQLTCSRRRVRRCFANSLTRRFALLGG